MIARLLGSDLSLVRQGAVIAWAFGPRSLGGLLRSAELLRSNMLDPGSFVADEDGLHFRLRNPPLRVGAFGGVSAALDGRSVRPEQAFVDASSRGEERSFRSVTREAPVELAVGERHRFRLRPEPVPGAGLHTVRLELHSVAIPPAAWIEFRVPFEGRA